MRGYTPDDEYEPGFGAVKKHTVWCCNKLQPLISERAVHIRHQLNIVK